jgi:hypothetical protein
VQEYLKDLEPELLEQAKKADRMEEENERKKKKQVVKYKLKWIHQDQRLM